MKALKKIALGFLVLLIIALPIALIVAKSKTKLGLPDYSEDIKLKNLKAEVRVMRDEVGTPHIFAKSDADLYRATGFLMAQERMWQMDLLRRVTLGRLSEIFGEDYVDTDVLLRSLRYSEKSKKIIEETAPEILAVVEAFSDGVNQYIEQYKENYPLEFFILGYEPEKWEPYHSYNLIGYMAWDLKAGWNEIILDKLAAELDSNLYAELLPQNQRYKTAVFENLSNPLLSENKLKKLAKLEALGLDVLSGSNNWAVSGKKSTTGMPIVANDMHLAYNVPGIWMQIHQKVEGGINVSGLALPGQPFAIVGHNDSIAWGMTNTYVDNLDYYEERINPDNPNQYQYMGEWKDFIISKEIIKIRKDSIVEKEFRYNHRGPVVSETKGIKDKVLTIHWVGDEPSNEIVSIYKVNRVNNWEEFKDAFKDFKSISQNIVYGDKQGNIGLYACAGVPIRKRNAAFEILPGWTDEYDWKGMIPFEELPHEFNPARGYVSSANNKTVGEDYPYHIGSWYSMPYRIERIRELLEAKDKLSVEDFKEIQNDTKSKYAERIINKCFSKLDNNAMKGAEEQVYLLLENWDGTMDKDLVQPTILEFFQYFLVQETFKDEMGEDLFTEFMKNSKLFSISVFNLLEQENSPWIDNVKTNEVEQLAEIVNKAYSQTILYLEENYGKNIQQWKWGNIHTLTLTHPLGEVELLDKVFNLNRGPFAVNGSNHTIAPYSYALLDPSSVSHGASHRHIYSLENWDSTISVIPTGNSGIVSSEFYCDQAKLYINGKYHSDFFSEEEVKKNAKYEMKLVPVK